MSRYLVDKFLFRVDRNPEALAEYRRDPAGYVIRWEEHEGPMLNEAERTSGHRFTPEERQALSDRDYEKLYAMGAHPFILWTIMLYVHWDKSTDFLRFAHEYADRIRPYGLPDFST